MSNRRSRQRLFDDEGHEIGYVDQRGGHHRRRVWPWMVALLATGVFGYWLSTPAGERFSVAAWEWAQSGAR